MPAKPKLRLVKPAIQKRAVGPLRRPNSEFRSREHLTTLESNSEVPVLNFLFEFSEEFRGISAKTRCRDFSRQA
jgi:hypothetical protein